MKIQRHRCRLLLLALVGAILAKAGGVSWAGPAPAIRPPAIIQLYCSPRGAVFALTAGRGGLFHASPTGGKWRQSTNLPDAPFYAISADGRGNLYLSTASGVYQSRDAGATWRHMSGSKVAFLQFSSQDSIYLAKIWGQGLFIGATTEVNLAESAMKRIKALPAAPVQCVTFSGPQAIFVGFFGQGVYRSETGARYWEQENTGLSDWKVLSLGTSPAGTVFAGTYGGGLATWSRERDAWSKVNTGLKDGIIQCMAFGPNGLILAGSHRQGAVVSRDNARSWQRLKGIPADADICALAVGPDGRAYAGGQQGLWVSKDRGKTWQEVALGQQMAAHRQ